MLVKSLMVPEQLPIYPVKEQVVFPHMVFPLFVEYNPTPLVGLRPAKASSQSVDLMSALGR